jgi:hypothetical protein
VPDVVTAQRASGPARLLPYALEVVAVLALFAVAGAGCGWLWFHVWNQPTGIVDGHVWYSDEESLRDVFDSTAWYVLFAAAGGVVVGGLATVFGRRAPILTLVTVLAGSALAAWLMLRTGLALSPEDPQVLAKTAADGTELRGRLSLEGGNSPYLAWPLASLTVLMVLNFLLSSGDRIKEREDADPRWLSRNQPG